MNKHNLDIILTITLERDGKAIKGSPAYLAQKIGSTRHNVLCALYKVRKGRSYRVHGWRIVAEKRKGGNLLQYAYTDPGTIAEAVQEAEWETVDKPVKVWHLLAKDTVDEGVLKLLQNKDKTNKRVEAATK